MISTPHFLVSHPTGNTFVRSLLAELEKKNQLKRFFTTIGFGEEASPFFSYLKARRGYHIPDSKISRQWFPECFRLIAKQSHDKSIKLTDQSYRELDTKVSNLIGFNGSSVFHAYEDGAASSFLRAKDFGIQCSYELPIAHWKTIRHLLAEEAERHPHWEPTLVSTREPEEKLIRKEAELKLADRITCPSQFVMDTIPIEIRKKIPCQIAPFGSPDSEPMRLEKKSRNNSPFKLLFVGSMTQRKGLADLFEAMQLLKKEPVTLSILGQPSMPREFYRKQCPNFKYFPPCSNEKVRQVMKKHDALVLPSIVEGRALVQQEALSCGLPIIVTPNSGGEDLISEGITGHLVPIRSPQKIAEKINACLQSKLKSNEIQIYCKEKANLYKWSAYAQRIIDFNLSKNGKIADNI